MEQPNGSDSATATYPKEQQTPHPGDLDAAPPNNSHLPTLSPFADEVMKFVCHQLGACIHAVLLKDLGPSIGASPEAITAMFPPVFMLLIALDSSYQEHLASVGLSVWASHPRPVTGRRLSHSGRQQEAPGPPATSPSPWRSTVPPDIIVSQLTSTFLTGYIVGDAPRVLRSAAKHCMYKSSAAAAVPLVVCAFLVHGRRACWVAGSMLVSQVGIGLYCGAPILGLLGFQGRGGKLMPVWGLRVCTLCVVSTFLG